ncbi:7-carboxy-7-deazaguanine synthase QueE [Thermomonas brevis]|uniref:7-carboxy-7-deazaguanine synthase n=1 Tax=Thermomonas brevis TaxID=215691 RepID=A0A7G9QW74_9GAMM|nr:7-carboxy-7-deazaguanine synthase QueE [Thermomonas brevis]QNN47599.1 7-carboxy-7-deazaguanine synthase QueE [Thermomonas brevis]
MNDVADAAAASAARQTERLKLTEIFFSLQGEARDAGWPTVFVRLTGCPLRCTYCDTTYSFYGGQWWEIDAILTEVARHGARHVCVTGGEPLAQKRCLQLLEKLCDAGYAVSLETSGALDIAGVDPRVSRVLDVKTPGSGEEARNLWSNLPLLTAHDQVKFVICSREDFDWAKQILAQHRLHEVCDVLFSPSAGQVEARALADWIIEEKLPVRFQMQLHKILWGEEPGR